MSANPTKRSSTLKQFVGNSRRIVLRVFDLFLSCCLKGFNPFQPSVAFHIETSHLICSANQMTGFYMKFRTKLKWINPICITLCFKCFQYSAGIVAEYWEPLKGKHWPEISQLICSQCTLPLPPENIRNRKVFLMFSGWYTERLCWEISTNKPASYRTSVTSISAFVTGKTLKEMRKTQWRN